MSDTQPTGGKNLVYSLLIKRAPVHLHFRHNQQLQLHLLHKLKKQQDSNSEDELDEQASKVLSTICLEKNFKLVIE